MWIAEAAKSAGVNPQTLRYYERRGLLKPAGRGRSGYREYSADDVRMLRFVKRAQELGLSLTDVQALLKLRRTPAARRQSVRKVAEVRLADLDRRIADLTRMREPSDISYTRATPAPTPTVPFSKRSKTRRHADDRPRKSHRPDLRHDRRHRDGQVEVRTRG
jgi:DNA-binding transcriptional MerR regulator